MLVLVSGLSGSGKSTVAAAIGRATNGEVLASDRVRKELAGLDPTDSAASDWHQGIYTDDWTARTYDRLLELAQDARSGTAARPSSMPPSSTTPSASASTTWATTQSVPTVIVWTELDDAIARERIERRARTRNTASDATFAIRERQVAQLAETPLVVPAGALSVTIDTGADGPAIARSLLHGTWTPQP